ncbi:MAG: MBL fold metallo-hydrolase [Deltaproteobacteria bacterium]|nr:MBL fold metallo-hydrolase [Deltaproteobacteria bacterium]MBN2674672.1 MBL fold metallo-hydrolase [Deltaproteobacteria bacterium]
MKFETVVTGAFQENCYILWDNETNDGIIIDPGDDASRIEQRVKALGLNVIGIYNTHGHFDHIGAVQPLKEALDIPFAIHTDDRALVEGAAKQGAMFGLDLPLSAPKVETWLKDAMKIEVGKSVGTVLHTPGHTPGGVCFLFEPFLFVGDTLFAGSVGRTDLPGGNSRQLIDSIQKKLMVLADSTRVLAGHGPETSIGKERKYNPFIIYGGSF